MCWLPVNLCSFGRALGKVLSTPRKISFIDPLMCILYSINTKTWV